MLHINTFQKVHQTRRSHHDYNSRDDNYMKVKVQNKFSYILMAEVLVELKGKHF